MSHQVLARKWRPHNFEEMAGQEHVLRMLIQALNTNRLHHAYLFTGTRGVGKTTVARILAKCLNCETGISAQPCGKCDTCQDIDEGRFVDLIEVDAASRTKVEDTRELLDNVQYAPTYGRFKIYLIDEVHMLSGHSFNALLKTLEEPPEHVKFLLATTDPQKLPTTVLSRCLQFHLKNLNVQYITDYLCKILTKENINSETTSIQKIAKAARGSMRDALSLLDQAIAFTHGNININDIHTMLGTIEQNHVEKLLHALASQDGKQLLDITADLAERGADFFHVLEDLSSAFHAIAVAQIIPKASHEEYDPLMIETFAQQFSKEDIQLYYQITLIGQRDLSLANDPKTGFEMILLRLLAFKPVSQEKTEKKTGKETTTLEISTPTLQKIQVDNLSPKTSSPILISDWAALIKKLDLSGMDYTLASNCILKTITNNRIELVLSYYYATFLNEKVQTRLNETLNRFFNQDIELIIHLDETKEETPAQQTQRIIDTQHQEAIKNISEDPKVQAILDKFGAVIKPELVKKK